MALRRGFQIPISVAVIALSAAMLVVFLPCAADALSTSAATVPGNSELLIAKARRLEGASFDVPFNGRSLEEEDDMIFHRKTYRSLMYDIDRYKRWRRSSQQSSVSYKKISEELKQKADDLLKGITEALTYYFVLPASQHAGYVEDQRSELDLTVGHQKSTQVERLKNEAKAELSELLENILPDDDDSMTPQFAKGIAYLLSQLTVELYPGKVIEVNPGHQGKLKVIGDNIGDSISPNDFFRKILHDIPPAGGNPPPTNLYKICERINEQTREQIYLEGGSGIVRGIVAEYNDVIEREEQKADEGAQVSNNHVYTEGDLHDTLHDTFAEHMRKANKEYYKNKKHGLTVLPQSSTNEPSTNESPVTQDGPSAACKQCVDGQEAYYKELGFEQSKHYLCRLFCMNSEECSEKNCANYVLSTDDEES